MDAGGVESEEKDEKEWRLVCDDEVDGVEEEDVEAPDGPDDELEAKADLNRALRRGGGCGWVGGLFLFEYSWP